MFFAFLSVTKMLQIFAFLPAAAQSINGEIFAILIFQNHQK